MAPSKHGVELLGGDMTTLQADIKEGNTSIVPEMGGDTTLQVDIKEGNTSIVPEMDGKTPSDTGLEHEVPTKTGLVDSMNETNGGVKETDHAANANLPKDAVDEWPAPKQIHSFYIVRFRSYEDPQLKSKIDQANKEVQRKNEARFQILDALKAKQAERSKLMSQLQPVLKENKKYWTVIEEKRKEREPLQAALGQLRTENTAAREKSMGFCSSEEELDDLIRSLHYQIQHESNTLSEEKQLLKEIKQLEATREKVIANAAIKAKIQDSKGQQDAIQDQVKLIGVDLNGVFKEKEAIKAQMTQLLEKVKVADDAIKSLEDELGSITERRNKALQTLNGLRRVHDEANTCFYQNRLLLNLAKDLAIKKDVKGLEELSHREVEKFIKQYSSDKTFRDDYEKRILPSLDSRQLSRDGCMRNPDEKPIILEVPPPVKLETASLEVIPKKIKEVVKQSMPVDTVSTKKAQGDELTRSIEVDMSEDTSKTRDLQQSMKESSESKVDPSKLKETRREEEIAKAKQAMERKKKKAEKAEAKAAARAQKEAEKKQKEKEKRAKKKAGTAEPALPAEQTETEVNNTEPKEADVKLETVSEKSNEQKEKARYRNKNRPRIPDQLPKVILKRKKSHPYGYWTAAAGTLAVILAIIGYYALGGN